MYKYRKPTPTCFNINTSTEGETIENKLKRILDANEPITDTAPIVYTERKDGIKPEYDPRTDKWEIAIEAMDKVDKSNKARREERIKDRETKVIKMEKPNELREQKTGE